MMYSTQLFVNAYQFMESLTISKKFDSRGENCSGVWYNLFKFFCYVTSKKAITPFGMAIRDNIQLIPDVQVLVLQTHYDRYI